MFRASIGLIMLFGATHASAALYDDIRQDVRNERGMNDLDQEVKEFLAAVYEEGWKLTPDGVQEVIVKNQNYCESVEQGNPAREVNACMRLLQKVQELAGHEERIRQLGRTLEAIAASYELPLSELDGQPGGLDGNMRAVINLWSTGNDAPNLSGSGIAIGSRSAGDASAYRGAVQNLADALQALTNEERIAAVWRYRYGYRLLAGERSPDHDPPANDPDAPDTERQFLFKRWEEVERALQTVWNTASQNVRPSREDGEGKVEYLSFPEEIADLLPTNIILWARVDTITAESAANVFPYGDVGLEWRFSKDPVFPSLLTQDLAPIPGGDYPPEPAPGSPSSAEGSGLCSMPGYGRGFLCRDLAQETSSCPDPEDETLDPDLINLVGCTSSEPVRDTFAGADICRDIEWHVAEPFDPQTRCSVSLRCADRCVQGVNTTGVAGDKTADGTIPICLNNSLPLPASYLLYHELVHAYQKCDDPPGFDPYTGLNDDQKAAACCQVEGEAYRAQCALMEEDGFFTNPDGTPRLASDGTPINAETCAEALTDRACGEQQGYDGCPVSRTYDTQFIGDLYEAQPNNPAGVPEDCADAIDRAQMDARVKALLDTVEDRADVCAPLEQTQYVNRIGNNLCFIGRCAEESLELRRIEGGRSPVGVQGQTAPFDDPFAGGEPGITLSRPPPLLESLPPYRPSGMVKELEMRLCQMQGLSPQTPPALCTFQAARRLNLPLQVAYENVESIVSQTATQRQADMETLSLGLGLGTRIGADVYGLYLARASDALASLLGTANGLLFDLMQISFPTKMCPLDGAPPFEPLS